MAKQKKLTAKQLEIVKKLSEENNKLRWFCVAQPFKYNNNSKTLKPGWYEKTGTENLKSGSWIHDIKLRNSKKNIIISDADYERVIKKFDEVNKHLE